ncbi:MAG: hypothetical protein AAGE01_17805 [Pseudomonadota bacterium]
MSDQFFRLFLAPKPGAEEATRLVEIARQLNVENRFGYFDDDEHAHKDDQYARILDLLIQLDEPGRSGLMVRARVLRVEYVPGAAGKKERVVFDS